MKCHQTSKEEIRTAGILGSGRNLRSYILTYFRSEREPLTASSLRKPFFLHPLYPIAGNASGGQSNLGHQNNNRCISDRADGLGDRLTQCPLGGSVIDNNAAQTNSPMKLTDWKRAEDKITVPDTLFLAISWRQQSNRPTIKSSWGLRSFWLNPYLVTKRYIAIHP